MREFRCEKCNHKITISEVHEGKKVKCPGCRNIVVVPGVGKINLAAKESPEQSEERSDRIVGSTNISSNQQREKEEEKYRLVAQTMACPYCCETILDDATKCKHCGELFLDRNAYKGGTPVFVTPRISDYLHQRVQYTGTSGMAVASFVAALIGIWPLGIIFGHIGLSNIRKAEGGMGGTRLATAGLVLSYIQFVCWLIFLGAVFSAGDIGLL